MSAPRERSAMELARASERALKRVDVADPCDGLGGC
jgi:hypothetical protein